MSGALFLRTVARTKPTHNNKHIKEACIHAGMVIDNLMSLVDTQLGILFVILFKEKYIFRLSPCQDDHWTLN